MSPVECLEGRLRNDPVGLLERLQGISNVDLICLRLWLDMDVTSHANKNLNLLENAVKFEWLENHD
jgi:hypothetical protein